MHFDDEVPVFIFHILEADISKDTCIVEQDIDPTEGFYGCLDDTLSVLYTVVVGDSLPSGSFDLVDNDVSGLKLSRQQGRKLYDDCALDLGRIALALEGGPKIIDNDIGTPRGKK
jgi:hypothetical protein